MALDLARALPAAGPIERTVLSFFPSDTGTVSRPKIPPDSECPICFEPYLAHNDTSSKGCHAIQLNPCNHLIGDVCLKAWANSAANGGRVSYCPTCTRPLQPCTPRQHAALLAIIVIAYVLMLFGPFDYGLEILLARHARVVRHRGWKRVYQASIGLSIMLVWFLVALTCLGGGGTVLYAWLHGVGCLLNVLGVYLYWRLGWQRFTWS